MNRARKLKIQQLDRKIAAQPFPDPPLKGWIYTIRTALNMSLSQMGKKMGLTSPTVLAMERREVQGTVSLKNLQRAAAALNLKFVYGFLPNDGTLEKLIEKQALIVAQKIVAQTDTTMKLENQQVGTDRLEMSIKELADEIKNEIPKYLWD